MIGFITSISGRSLYRTCSLESNNVLGGDLEFILLPLLFAAVTMLVLSHTGPILPIDFIFGLLNMIKCCQSGIEDMFIGDWSMVINVYPFRVSEWTVLIDMVGGFRNFG